MLLNIKCSNCKYWSTLHMARSWGLCSELADNRDFVRFFGDIKEKETETDEDFFCGLYVEEGR